MIVPILSSRRFVGRDAELRLLVELRRAAAGGRPSVVLVGGEAGIGKTRLLTEFAAGITGGRAPHYAVGQCLEDAPRPFGPFRALLARLVAVEPQALDAAPPSARRAMSALIPDSFATGAATPTAGLEKAELFVGVLAFLAAVTALRTTILVLEDIHWADAATLDLLCYLAPRLGNSRIMLVATFRDDNINTEHPLFTPLGRLGRHDDVREIHLRPLEDGDARTLIDDALGRKYTLDPERIRRVVLLGEGNPFFIEEILKKALERDDGSATEALPISIRATIVDRVGRLTPAERSVLEHASVLGLRFDLNLLARVMERDRSDVERTLRRLRDAQFLADGNSRFEFRFSHGLTRQSIYDELLASEVQDLHLRIFTTLESEFDGTTHLDVLAHHAWKAQLRDATLRYSELAGDTALGVNASALAATYFERALEVAGDDEIRVRLLDKASEAYLLQSDFRRVVDTSLRLHTMLLARSEFDGALRAVTRAANEIGNNGKPRDGVTMIQTFANAYGDRLNVDAANHMYSSLARLATACDDAVLARASLANVRGVADLSGFTRQVYWLAQLMCSEAEVDLAAWKKAVSALRDEKGRGLTVLRAQILHQIASSSTVFGEHAEGERAVNEAIALNRELGLTVVLAFAQAVKAGIMTLLGRLGEARTCIEAALAEPDAFPVRMEVALAAVPAAIALGDEELTERCLSTDIAQQIQDTGVRGTRALMLGLEAARCLARGRPEKARTLLREAIDDDQHQFGAIHLWPLAARFVDDGRLGRIRDWCEKYAENPHYRIMQACAALCKAIAARRAGHADAIGLAEAAAERYRALAWPLHEAQALELAARPDAALALYRECESVTDVRRLEIGRPASPRRTKGATALSPREREVAALVSRGLTNRAVALRLSVTEKTIEKYLSAIYAKLQFSTRTQLAAHVVQGEALSGRL